MNPQYQLTICKDAKRCFIGDYPTLKDVSIYFFNNTAVIWLIPQLFDLSEYCGCKEKISRWQLEQCATIIFNEYNYLKITEIMLFFYQFKAGYFGKFYGNIDPLTITDALHKYIIQRNDAYAKFEREENLRRIEQDKLHSISWDEYCHMKKMKKENLLNIENIKHSENQK